MPSNPNFQPPAAGLKAEWARMVREPVGLARPLLVLAGWRAPAWPSRALAHRLARLAGGPANMADGLSFTFCLSIEAAVNRTARFARQRWPERPIDIVGISMGGLIARAAAIAGNGRAALDIRRVFTLGTPHRGARLAPFVCAEPLARTMCPGSEFLRCLDAHLPQAAYELICYARLRDSWVGARNTAPPGRDPCWTPGPVLLSHQTITLDPLIRADIARRLRGEPPLALRTSPPPSD